MVTKSNEEKKFDSQIATLSEEIKNFVNNIKKYQKNDKEIIFLLLIKDITNGNENSLKTSTQEIFRLNVYGNEIYCHTK